MLDGDVAAFRFGLTVADRYILYFVTILSTTESTFVQDNTWMGDYLVTTGDAGMGSGLDAAQRQVDSVIS